MQVNSTVTTTYKETNFLHEIKCLRHVSPINNIGVTRQYNLLRQTTKSTCKYNYILKT